MNGWKIWANFKQTRLIPSVNSLLLRSIICLFSANNTMKTAGFWSGHRVGESHKFPDEDAPMWIELQKCEVPEVLPRRVFGVKKPLPEPNSPSKGRSTTALWWRTFGRLSDIQQCSRRQRPWPRKMPVDQHRELGWESSGPRAGRTRTAAMGKARAWVRRRLISVFRSWWSHRNGKCCKGSWTAIANKKQWIQWLVGEQK